MDIGGIGGLAARAVALHRSFTLALDDKRAVERALREAGLASKTLEILRTQDVVVDLIRAGVLDVASADAQPVLRESGLTRVEASS